MCEATRSFWDPAVLYYQVEEAVVGGAWHWAWSDLILLWVVSLSYLFTQPGATSGLGCFFSTLGPLVSCRIRIHTGMEPVLGSGDTQEIQTSVLTFCLVGETDSKQVA